MQLPKVIHLLRCDSGVQIQVDCPQVHDPLALTLVRLSVWGKQGGLLDNSLRCVEHTSSFNGTERSDDVSPVCTIHPSKCLPVSSLPNIQLPFKGDLSGLQDTGSKVKSCRSGTCTFLALGPFSWDALGETRTCRRRRRVYVELRTPRGFCHLVEKLEP